VDRVAEAQHHMLPRRRMPRLRLPIWRHHVLRRRVPRLPGLGWPRLTLLRHASCHLLFANHLNGLTSQHPMLPPTSQPLTWLRRYPVRLARLNERGNTSLHLHPRREDASAATNRPTGKPLAIRSLARAPARVKLPRSAKLQLPRVVTEIETQIGR
jgi:hypothetical protein